MISQYLKPLFWRGLYFMKRHEYNIDFVKEKGLVLKLKF